MHLPTIARVSIAILLLQHVRLAAATHQPRVVDAANKVTYEGLERNGIEVFLNVPYGEDTGGENRFKPPRPVKPSRGSTIHAKEYGPACMQQLGGYLPLEVSNATNVSEDCLNLNVARPHGARAGDGLPVMVFTHGGGYFAGMNSEISTQPDGLILESVKSGEPILHVAMNYRLGVFGFAHSEALRAEGSQNAGLRDQRLALEWVQDNIEYFGGDPKRVTLFGQSAGGLSVGIQVLAYGGAEPAPFHQVICQSQAMDLGITSNSTEEATQLIVDDVRCGGSNSTAILACLRNIDVNTLLKASINTHSYSIGQPGGSWGPSVDGDFLPAAPSELVRQRRFANVTTMMGWLQDDTTILTPFAIRTTQDTADFVQAYLPDVSSENREKLLSLYPSSDFQASTASNLTREFFRSSRIYRDILLACLPMWYGENIGSAGNDVYLYLWNQTILDGIAAKVDGYAGLGPFHTSEFAYVFGNLSHYDLTDQGIPFRPTRADESLKVRASRSWASYANSGRPGRFWQDTFHGFEKAFSPRSQEVKVFVAGGPREGLTTINGPGAKPEVAEQKLKERCAFITSPEMIQELEF